MIDTSKPYPTYKDSNVAWLGQVPEHWKVKRLRNVTQMRISSIDKNIKDGELPVRLCNYIDVYKNERITERIPYMHATALPDEIERFRLQLGDVLITKDSEVWNDIGVPALVEYSKTDLICGYHLALLRPSNSELLGAFLLRALQTKPVAYQLHIEANGVTRYGLSHNAIKSVRIPVPSLPEQTAIVRYLDYMGRRIGKLIRAKQKLIKLLEEQKQAIIHRAVTRSLDPNVRLKPSGVEWLGDVPEHWEVKPLKLWVSINKETLSEVTNSDYLFRYIDITTVGTGALKRPPERMSFKIAPSRARRILHRGDTIISTVRTYLKAVWFVDEDSKDLIASTGFAVLTPGISVEPQYLRYVIQDENFVNRVSACSIGVAYPAITETVLGRFPVVLPSKRTEQIAIIRHIEVHTQPLDHAIMRTLQEITLLREYRTCLISDVVTGKFDVREAAAKLSDEPAEIEDIDRTDELESVEDASVESDSDAVFEESDA